MSVISEKSTASRHSRTCYGRPPPRPPASLYSFNGDDGSKALLSGHHNVYVPVGMPPSFEQRMRMPMAFIGDAENTTVITGNTSELSYGGVTERFQVQPLPAVRATSRRCCRFFGVCAVILISLAAFCSPPLIVSIPFLWPLLGLQWPEVQCGVDCQGMLLNLFLKMIILCVAFYVMYRRRSVANLPRLHLPQAVFLFFILFFLFAFWLFFVFRFVLGQRPEYREAVSFAISLADALTFLHCFWIFYEICQSRPRFIVTITRDPDGESKTMQIGALSIQQAVVQILQFYATNFSSFNIYLDRARRMEGTRKSSKLPCVSGFKMYDIEGLGAGDGINEASARSLMEAATRQRMNCHNERLYEELEWEKRLKKRKYRLLGCTEDAFSYVQPITPTTTAYRGEAMSSARMASSVLGGIAKPLNRYLKLTRRQPQHLPNAIVKHLDKCLAYRFSARTFLQRFFSDRFPATEASGESKWSILSDHLVSSQVFDGLEFVLRSFNQNSDVGVQLHCTVSLLPFLNITEQHEKGTVKFALKINSDA